MIYSPFDEPPASKTLKENIQAKGKISLYSGKAKNIKYDSSGLVESYDFESKELIKSFQNVLTYGYFGFIATGYLAPAVIAIGNGDNGTINGTGGGVNILNTPSINDIKLNNELNQGRFPCTARTTRFNTVTGVVVFDALYPRNNYSGQVTEWGLFFGELNSVAVNSKDSGTLMARKSDNFTKNAGDDIQIVWTIQTTIN